VRISVYAFELMPSRSKARSAPILIVVALALGIAGALIGSVYLVLSMVLVILVQAVSLWTTRNRPSGGDRK